MQRAIDARAVPRSARAGTACLDLTDHIQQSAVALSVTHIEALFLDRLPQAGRLDRVR
jgi:hypothetical protein